MKAECRPLEVKGETEGVPERRKVGTDLFSPHGLKHFLQLDAELLDVVEDNAGL